MVKTFLAIVAAAMLSAIVAAIVIHKAGPSTADLDADIASTTAKLANAEAEAARYSGGLLLMQAQLRETILKNTLAMLEQKRESFLRGISLAYQEPTPRTSSPTDEATAMSELAKARADAKAAQQEAAMYSVGLMQAMALVREATAKTTEAAIEQRVVLMKLGIPLPALSDSNSPAPRSPGKTTSDKDAL
jgi:hypothetical protein